MSEIGENSSERLVDQQHREDSPTATVPEGEVVHLPADPLASSIFTREPDDMLVEWFVDRPLFYNQGCPEFKHCLKMEQ